MCLRQESPSAWKMASSNGFCLILMFMEASVSFRLSGACPVSSGNFNYDPGFDFLTVDTGNKTRTPSIMVTAGGYQGSLVRKHIGCSTNHEYKHNGSLWSYQVARFKFESNVYIRSRIRLIGTNALSLIGENISIDTNGMLQTESSGMLSPYSEPRFVGGFVANSGVDGVPYGGPGRGKYVNGEVGGAGHGGRGGGDSNLSYGSPYGLTDTDLYLGGSTGAFTGSKLPGVGGPAIELEASGNIEIRGSINANAISGPSALDGNMMTAGNSGGLVRLLAQRVNISQGAEIYVKGSIELCGNSSNCKAGGGSGGIVQIISRSGFIAPHAIILSGIDDGYRGAPEDGFLYIKGVKDGHFQTFPNTPFSWGQSPFSKTLLPSTTRATTQQSTFQGQLSTHPSPTTAPDTATPTVILISMSRPSYQGTTLNMTTSVVPDSSGIRSQWFPPSSEVSSPTLHRPHVTTSSTKAPPSEKDNVESLRQLLDQVKLLKNKGNISIKATVITDFMESFEGLTVVGNLTTEIINISISLIQELNGLMISEGLSVNQSELQHQISTLVTTVDGLLDDRDAAAWRDSGMVMNLVEALEKTSSLALNSTSATNQSIFLSKKNIEMITTVEYFDSSSNLTVPNPNKQFRPTGSITFQASGFSGGTGNDTLRGRLVVSMVVYRNLTSHFANIKQSSSDRSDLPQAVLDSEIISVIASYDGRPVHSLDKEAFLTFGNKKQDGIDPRCLYWKSLPGKMEWLSNGVSMVMSDSKQTVCSTNHLTSFAVIMRLTDIEVSPEDQFALQIITYIGCGISLVALSFAIIIFLCLRSLTDIKYQIHLHLCIALALAQVLFLTGITATEKPWLCKLVAILLHYLYTASFTWMSAEGLHLYFKIVTVFNLEGIKMKYYLIYCWGSPIIVVGISAVAQMEGYGGQDTCWLSFGNGFIWAFVGPVLAIILFNTAMLGMTIKVLVSLRNVAESNAHLHSVRSGVKAALVLMPLLGITWVFGLFSVNSKTVAFQYLFAIINSLQGLFIFAFHCIGNTEVRAALNRVKKRHSMKIVSSQDVSLDKIKSKSKALKPSNGTDDPKDNTVKVVDPADLNFKPID
ncbi:hypothetical protein ACROYT_G013653 [Oculina patagonica]